VAFLFLGRNPKKSAARNKIQMEQYQ